MDSYLQLLLDPLIFLGFGDPFLFATEVEIAYALVGELGASLRVVLVMLIVFVLCMPAQHYSHGVFVLQLGFFQVLLG